VTLERVKNPLIILNPAARSERAHRFADRLESLCHGASIRQSSHPGDAERLAAEGVAEGYTTIVAAGGDGTVNEVVNGINAAGNSSVRLGILPVGTMNVFAMELGIPANSLEKSWEVIMRGETRFIDLPYADSTQGRRRFVQLAGVGLDAEVVRRTSRESKKALGPLSYLLSLAQVAGVKPPRIILRDSSGTEREGSFLLLGNGRYYGGPFRMFRQGSVCDGLIDVLLFRNQSPWDLLRYMHALLIGQHVGLEDVEYFQTSVLEVSSGESVPFELDGELAGYLPVSFGLEKRAMEVLAPSSGSTC
jgi:YegS/Rv2252/BmrU family lipid kinase